MAENRLQAFITTQCRLYQTYERNITTLNNTLKYQRDIQIGKQIPRQYRPRVFLKTLSTNSTACSDFKQEFEELFFKQLDKAVTLNTVSLVIEKEAQASVVSLVESHLVSLKETLSPTIIAHYYHSFLTQAQLTNHKPSPALKSILSAKTTASDNPPPPPPPLQSKHSKRKQRTEQNSEGPMTKKPKQDNHFLYQGQRLNPLPP